MVLNSEDSVLLSTSKPRLFNSEAVSQFNSTKPLLEIAVNDVNSTGIIGGIASPK